MSAAVPAPARFALRARRAILGEGARPRDALVVVADGRVESVEEPKEDALAALRARGVAVEDLGDAMLLPGLVDSHVHVNQPGRSDWEGWDTATRAAALGGVTTLVDMPLNSDPVTTTARALEQKKSSTDRYLHVDVGFWGGVVPGNAGELPGLAEGGALGCKAFLCHSGIDEFPDSKEADLRRAMPVMRGDGIPLLAHAELPGPAEAAPILDALSPRQYRTYLLSRPRGWEDAAVALLIQLCRETGCRVHVVHLSSASALPLLRRAKEEGLPISAETCPHYLCLSAEEVPDGATHWKCAPPIREAGNREQLWDALREGLLDVVVSDHSPCTPELKLPGEGDFLRAWGGIASLGLGLRSVWTEARRRGFEIGDVVTWMATRPAALAGLEQQKGRIAVGVDADLVAFDPDAQSRLGADDLAIRHKVTPYLGRTLDGRVEHVWLRGRQLVRDGRMTAEALGRHLLGRRGGQR